MYLIIGASGFIGSHLYSYCKNNNVEVQGTYFIHPYDTKWIKFDICSDNLSKICHDYLHDVLPEAVIICGANISIDSCFINQEESYKLNVEGTKRILCQADIMGLKSVFISSEAVFDGQKGMYSEDDIPNPITVYGSQKLQVEQYMVQNLNDYLIFRVSRAVGCRFGEKDIFGEFYNKITRNEDIVCLRNQSFCITEVNDIANVIILALQKKLKGLYHLSSDNYISRYELARIYADRMFGGYERINEKEFGDIPFKDNRHIYGGLNGKKLEDSVGYRYMNLDEIINKYYGTYIESI